MNKIVPAIDHLKPREYSYEELKRRALEWLEPEGKS
jgi:hypothetical protein